MVAAERPRPVYCVNEHEHRDRALADAVAAGRFTFGGETRELGLEPDWLDADLPEDEEWRIDWVKFYYGLDLADAYRATGTALPAGVGAARRELRRSRSRPTTTTARSPRAGSSTGSTPGSGCRRPTPASRTRWSRACASQVRHVRANLSPERNHRTLELYALLIASLALPGSAGPLARGSCTRTCSPTSGPTASTASAPRTTTASRCARSSARARTAAASASSCRAASTSGSRSRASSRATAGAPTARSPRSRTATPATTPSCCALAARLLARDDLLESAAGDYPDGGYFVQRTSDRYLIFDCGPLGDGGHGHYDALSIEAWAGERPLVIDPGRYTYAEGEPNLRHWFRGTAAHNTVTRGRRRPDALRALALLAAQRRATFLGASGRRHPRRRGPLARATTRSTGGA